MKDELAPISGQARDTQFGGWGATLVDSLDTLWIMGMEDDFAEAVEAALKIDFKPSDDRESEINMFEIIIRYLGGFIGAYDVSGCHDARLLNKALEVADMAYATFDTPNRMPLSRWKPGKAADGEEQLPALSVLIAEAASASVEFTRLSQITGDMRYFDAISRVTNVLDEQQGLTKLPGMWPISVDMRTPNLTFDAFFGLGAMADSAFEYLPKMHQLLNGNQPADQYRKMYEYAMDTAITHTMFRPMVEDKADILIASAKHDGPDGQRDDTGQHLVCFAGGMLALGGRLFDNQTYFDVGRKISDGCAWTYKRAPNGIMPEVFSMTPCPSWSECDYTPGASSFSAIHDGRYILRPEAIESIFYMFRLTGETKYQEIAWEMFQAIEANTKTEFGNAALQDVMETPPQKSDSMEVSLLRFAVSRTQMLTFCLHFRRAFGWPRPSNTSISFLAIMMKLVWMISCLTPKRIHSGYLTTSVSIV
jgi:mannosyl-oligosaccharide alpha-1,2-mannosidase